MIDHEDAAETRAAVYGPLPAELAVAPPDAVELSPFAVGAAAIEAQSDGAFGRALVHAPSGTVERQAVLAHALRVLAPGGALTVLAANDRGGRRVAAELEAYGCAVSTESRRHFRIAETLRPAEQRGIEAAIAAGALRFDETLGLWTQAGVFSFDRTDPGSRLLADHLPPLSGRGADLGCGLGLLARTVLASPKIAAVAALDLDRRAVDAARRNLADARASVRQADLRQSQPDLSDLDFIVSNPPFHDAGAEDRGLGQAFIARASVMLRRGGRAFLVANRHLPYEAILRERFSKVRVVVEAGGYKVFEAQR